jgi:hypothetical protein
VGIKQESHRDRAIEGLMSVENPSVWVAYPKLEEPDGGHRATRTALGDRWAADRHPLGRSGHMTCSAVKPTTGKGYCTRTHNAGVRKANGYRGSVSV